MAGWTLCDALHRIRIAKGDSPAMTCGGQRWTFHEFYERVNRLASAFHRFGWTKGDMIVIHSENCHRFMEVFFACARTGMVLVPISTRLKDDEIRIILEDVNPRGIVVDSISRSDLWTSGQFRVVISFEPVPEPFYTYEHLLTQEAEGPELNERIEEEDGIAVIYTAAIDGRPRGALLSHRNFVAQVLQTALSYSLRDGDVHGCFLPMYHTFGLYLSVVSAAIGIPNVILPKYEPQAALHAVIEEGVTFFAEFAPMAKRLLEAGEEQGHRLNGRIRFIIGLDTPDTIERYLNLGTRWFSLYGQTEVSGLVTTGEITDPRTQQSYAGIPMALSNISLRDELGKVVGVGETGEICVRGPVCISGYYRRPHQLRFTKDGWLKTGDLGRMDDRGALWFQGRKDEKDLIKPGGENVYPVEVEQVLEQHPAVQRACVIGVPDPEWRERVKAVVILKQGHSVTEQELIAFCKKRLAAFKCPTIVEFVSSLPMNNSVISRAQVREIYGNSALRIVDTGKGGT